MSGAPLGDGLRVGGWARAEGPGCKVHSGATAPEEAEAGRLGRRRACACGGAAPGACRTPRRAGPAAPSARLPPPAFGRLRLRPARLSSVRPRSSLGSGSHPPPPPASSRREPDRLSGRADAGQRTAGRCAERSGPPRSGPQ